MSTIKSTQTTPKSPTVAPAPAPSTTPTARAAKATAKATARTTAPAAASDVYRAGNVQPAPQPTSRINFVVHPGMKEIQDYARNQGWTEQGFTQLSVPWQDVVYTTDNWKTTHSLRSSEVPSPIVNGMINLPDVPKGTEVEFAIHVGVACHSPADIAGYRERGDVWLNNGGQNYRQIAQ